MPIQLRLDCEIIIRPCQIKTSGRCCVNDGGIGTLGVDEMRGNGNRLLFTVLIHLHGWNSTNLNDGVIDWEHGGTEIQLD